ncbi:Bacterial alpha-L-rhamnosidase [Neolewinella aurantiaca]|uniref:alpha-L-rhamnosidase n=1 Tax=Neolewinella aurantiaca TaxID=2602767 RepID=A0A5C7F0N3_9BACT|nr:alpha-L-rhamnosidase [Neolewinella aurantiaca]TXF82798.1 Bacterial alpha-L-rhamnosidase [Neolewinella aurantiaca]
MRYLVLLLLLLLLCCTPDTSPAIPPLPDQENWRAEWLSFPTEDEDLADTLNLPPAAYFRKNFTLDILPERAVLYCSALGLIEPRLNGEVISGDLFLPGWSDYNKRIYYHAYDVTDRLQEGENVLSYVLADGWYAGYVGPKSLSEPKNRELYGDTTAMISQLELTLADGSEEFVLSDESWKAGTGPLRYADLLMGEFYDARLENEGWDKAGFDDDNWARPLVQSNNKEQWTERLEPYPGSPVRNYTELKPVRITEPATGVYIFDMGQNSAGHVRLKVTGKAGDTIRLRHGEMLNTDGSLMTENLRFARASDTYVLKGEGTEIWEPRFTYHGYRYVEVSGLKSKPGPELLTGVPVSSSMQMNGSFATSDSMINRLYENIIWTQRSNFLEIPTDSPQRDERLGWLGDVQIFSRSGLYNADLTDFYRKWFADVRDAQYDSGAYANFAPRPYPDLVWFSPGWMDAGVMVPYNAWQFSGDTSLIADHYASMTKYMDFVINKSEPFGYFYPENSWTEIGPRGGFGDWLALTDKHLAHDILASIYLAHTFRIMGEMSTALGETAAAARYDELFRKSTAAFIDHYVAADGRFVIDETKYGGGKGYFEGERGFTGHTQSGYASAIYFDVLPENLRELAARHLVDLVEAADKKPTSGILGIRQLLPALSRIGRGDLAYDMLLDERYPGWGFQVANGATTIWERWNSYTHEEGFGGARNAKMNSFNHYAFGAVGQFLYGEMAGIRPDAPGFSSVIIQPDFGNGELRELSATYASVHGAITSAWEVTDDELTLAVEIPKGTTAKVFFPSQDGEVRLSEVGPGKHSFSAPARTYWEKTGK